MLYNDHTPPHFHAEYAEFKAAYNIKPVSVAGGFMPPRAQRMILQWAKAHQSELMDDWDAARKKKPLNPIDPLP
jgi:hypothetical protein